MSSPRILIAGIGNIFLGDDAFGVEVAQKLAQRVWPAGITVVDFGIRGVDLTFALMDGYDAVVLIDAVARGGEPGTLYVIEPEPVDESDPDAGELMMEMHNVDPSKVLRLATAMGGELRRIVLIGCEPHPPSEYADMDMTMSDAVRAAVDEAIPLVESVVDRLLTDQLFPATAQAAS